MHINKALIPMGKYPFERCIRITGVLNLVDPKMDRAGRLACKDPGLFPPPLAGLAGIPLDGGFETVDEAPALDASNVRVSDSDSMMVEFGPTGRFVARLGPRKVRAVTSLAGGESAIPGSPFYINLLEPWLRNETFPMLVSPHAVRWDAVSTQEFVPGAP